MTPDQEREEPRTQAAADGADTAPVTSTQARLWRAGRNGWALLGVAAAVALVGYLLSLVPLVVVPLILALFPATLLSPVASWLKSKGFPAALAAITAVVGGILLIVGVIGAMIPLVAAELPDLAGSAAEGLGQVQQQLEDGPLGLEIGGVDEILDMAQEQLGEAGELAGQAVSAATVAFETVAGLVLMFVVLFFYLKDGRRLSDGVVATVPAHLQERVHAATQRAWDTLGAYFRGQLLVALVDALAIGAGLLILGVPLAVPLSVLIFFGGLFPIVGAFVTGALAVLVALADGGLVTGLIVLGIVVAVQQLESNVLEPLILGHVIRLHPLVVLISITTGTVLLGIFGAFISVPIAAIVARVMDQIAGRTDDAHEESDDAADESDDDAERADQPADADDPRPSEAAARRT